MITLIHGDDTAASRSYFITARKKSASSITLEADQVTLTDLTQILTAGGLFGAEKDVFIENLLTKKKKSAELTAILALLDENSSANIYLWEGKELEKKTLSLLKNAKPHFFKLPQSLFQFLDGIRPNDRGALRLFHQTLETVTPEMVFAMIIRQFRLLLALTDKTEDPIDEVERLAPWQRQKLTKQAKLFKTEILKQHYHSLYEIDLAQKTGKLPYDLTSAIDFWLSDL